MRLAMSGSSERATLPPSFITLSLFPSCAVDEPGSSTKHAASAARSLVRAPASRGRAWVWVWRSVWHAAGRGLPSSRWGFAAGCNLRPFAGSRRLAPRMADEETETLTGDAGLTNMPTETRVRRAAYCGVCTMPVEYCEFGADYSACRKWFATNWRQVLPDEEAKAFLGLEPAGEVSPDELVALMTKLGLDGKVDDHAKRAQ
eukprot:scaffold5950_cov82-Isochrysis_galbana.AAC.2